MDDEEGSNDGGDEEQEEGSQQHGLPTWQPVDLDGPGGVAPSRARAPQLHMLANPAPDTHCLQLEGGLCATGESGADGRVHLWSTDDDELELKRSLAGHSQGVATLSFQVSQECSGMAGAAAADPAPCMGFAAMSTERACACACLRLAGGAARGRDAACPHAPLQRETGWLVAGSGGGPVKVWSLERCAFGGVSLWLCAQQPSCPFLLRLCRIMHGPFGCRVENSYPPLPHPKTKQGQAGA